MGTVVSMETEVGMETGAEVVVGTEPERLSVVSMLIVVGIESYRQEVSYMVTGK